MRTKLLGIAVMMILGLSFCGTGWAQDNSQGANTSALYSRQWLLGVTTPENPQAWPTSVERLYILKCGGGVLKNRMQAWTPGRNRGKTAMAMGECYLIKDTHGWFLYDTGLPDYLKSMPNGWQPGASPFRWYVHTTLMSQLKEIGVKPSDLVAIGLGSDDPTTVGNLELFPNTTVYLSQLEYEHCFSHPRHGPPGDPVPTFSPNHPVRMFHEDWDLFDDNSVIMVGTPGHDPGVTSLLVHLPKTGWVLITDDELHLRQNFYNDETPQFTGHTLIERMQMQLSQQRLRDLMNYYHAKMIVKFDYDQYKDLKFAPEYYQ